MRKYIATLLVSAVAVAAIYSPPTNAQTASAVVVSSCGTPPQTYRAGQPYPITQDTTGRQCSGSSSSGTSNVAIVSPLGSLAPASGVAVTLDTTDAANLAASLPPGTNQIGYLQPATAYLITSSTGVSSATVKNTGGTLFGFIAVFNSTFRTTGGHLMIYNLTADPGNGTGKNAICVPVDAGLTAVNYAEPSGGKVFSVGITIVASTGSDCSVETASTAFNNFSAGYM